MKRNNLWWSVGLLLSLAGLARADVRLPAVIGDNMVLQQSTETPIWGWADANEEVTVKGSWNAESRSIKAGADGKWRVKLPTASAGGPFTITVTAHNTITLENVMLGEVWLCSGQSNMEWTIGPGVGPGLDNSAEEIKNAQYPQIRLFKVDRTRADKPADNCPAKWQVCSPETIGPTSATAYFFGRRLYQELNVPIGLLESSWGGTEVELWMSEPAMRQISDLVATMDRTGDKPAHSVLYNGMIAPLIPYAIRGAIWYQGESNVIRARQYRTSFPAMIQNWRRDWGQGDFPFYFVQIAPFDYRRLGDAWADRSPELREAQCLSLSVPNTGMAVVSDTATDVKNIHPGNKQEAGARLALWALAKTYGQSKLVYSGPIYKEMKVEGDKIRIRFDHVGGGMVAKGESLTDFVIAGTDRKFVPAQARIDGDTVVVSSPEVAEPVAVRFGWSDIAVPNLFNKEGLPASPFRTDDWPGLTDETKW